MPDYRSRARGASERSRARAIIRREYGTSRNLMTSKIAGYGMLGPSLAYELSKGYDYSHALVPGGTMYGVSVVRQKPDGSTERLTKLSRGAFTSAGEAKAYIKELKKFQKLTQRGVRIPRSFGALD